MVAGEDRTRDTELPDEALREIERARWILEHPGVAARVSDLLGRPIEGALRRLPSDWHDRVGDITRAALTKALDAAVFSLGGAPDGGRAVRPARLLHNVLATASGAAGGAFGLAAVALELPVSTTVMLRGVAQVARANGEDLTRIETRLACLSVLALGGEARSDDAADTGYWAVRGILAKSVTDAASFLSRRGLVVEGAPPLVRLITTIAARFQVRISQQLAAKAVPVIGAVSGGAINLAFSDHFQNMAGAHFTIRRLERRHGEEAVRIAYESLE